MANKKCYTCQQIKPINEFGRNKVKYDGLNGSCKKCHNEYVDNYRAVQSLEVKTKICEYLSTHPCVDCGETDIIVLEFDHLDNKNYSISKMMNGSYPWKTIYDEILKCEIRCANCHKRKHALENGFFKHLFVTDGVVGTQ